MIKIPEPKTIVFGEVPYSFNGRLGLLGNMLFPRFPPNKKIRHENSCQTLQPEPSGKKKTSGPTFHEKTGYLWTWKPMKNEGFQLSTPNIWVK